MPDRDKYFDMLAEACKPTSPYERTFSRIEVKLLCLDAMIWLNDQSRAGIERIDPTEFFKQKHLE